MTDEHIDNLREYAATVMRRYPDDETLIVILHELVQYVAEQSCAVERLREWLPTLSYRLGQSIPDDFIPDHVPDDWSAP